MPQGVATNRNIIIQKQTRTTMVEPRELAGTGINSVFGYLFAKTARRPDLGSSPPVVMVSNWLDDLTVRSIGGSKDFNEHESGKYAFNAAIVLTPELFAKYGGRLQTQYAGELEQTSLSQRVESKSRQPTIYMDNLSFADLRADEIDEIVSHLIVFYGEVKSVEPLEPLHIGKKAVEQLLPMLAAEGSRKAELDAITTYLRDTGRTRELVPVGLGLSKK